MDGISIYIILTIVVNVYYYKSENKSFTPLWFLINIHFLIFPILSTFTSILDGWRINSNDVQKASLYYLMAISFFASSIKMAKLHIMEADSEMAKAFLSFSIPMLLILNIVVNFDFSLQLIKVYEKVYFSHNLNIWPIFGIAFKYWLLPFVVIIIINYPVYELRNIEEKRILLLGLFILYIITTLMFILFFAEYFTQIQILIELIIEAIFLFAIIILSIKFIKLRDVTEKPSKLKLEIYKIIKRYRMFLIFFFTVGFLASLKDFSIEKVGISQIASGFAGMIFDKFISKGKDEVLK